MHPRFLSTKLTVAVLCFYTLNSLHYDLGHLGLLQMHPRFLLTKVTYSRPMLLHLELFALRPRTPRTPTDAPRFLLTWVWIQK